MYVASQRIITITIPRYRSWARKHCLLYRQEKCKNWSFSTKCILFSFILFFDGYYGIMSPERLPLVFYNNYLQHRLRECAVFDRHPCSSHNRRHPVMPFRFIQLIRPPCFLYKSSFLCRQSSLYSWPYSGLSDLLYSCRSPQNSPLQSRQRSSFRTSSCSSTLTTPA